MHYVLLRITQANAAASLSAEGLFSQFLDDMTRIADSYHIGWDILCYDRSGTDGHVVADGDSREDCYAAADPYVVADGNRLRPLIACVPFDRVSAMAGCIDAYVRPNEAVITDGNLCLVKHSEVEVGKETLAHADLLAVIAVERLIDDNLVIGDVTKQAFEYLQSAGIVCRGEAIISVNNFLHGIEFLQQLTIYCRVYHSGEHLFLFSHSMSILLYKDNLLFRQKL